MRRPRINFTFFKRLPDREKRITFSTVLTLFRMLAAPFIVWAMMTAQWGVAFWLFLIAAITDMIDGTLARLLDQKTFLGACLDPIADKVLILSCFFTLTFVHTPLFALPLWFVLFILCKEVLLVGGALTLYMIQGHLEVHPTVLGKVNTFAQICFIIWLFACYFFHWLPIKTYYTMLGMLLVLGISTCVQYASIGWRQLRA